VMVPSAEIGASTALDDGPVPDAVADPAMAIASSGSTGLPKIIVSPGPGTFDPGRPAYATSQQMGAGAGQVQLVPAPLYHTNGFRIAHGALHRDELLVLMEHFDAEHAVSLIERYRVTTTTMAPVMLLRMARLANIEHRDLSSLRSLLQGAASCPPWLVRWWIDRIGAERFFVSYGSSERVGVTFLRGTEWLDHPGSVGRGLNTDVRILNDAGEELPPGAVGHVYLRSHDRSVPPYAYRGSPPAPSTEDGFTTVGDLGWLDEDGYLFIADRRLDMIVSGGVNVYPSEVEAALVEHPGVADVAVIGLPDDEWGQRVHALVEPAERSRPPSTAELRAHCRARLAPHKVPKSVEMVERLPRTAAGKLNRSSLAGERAARA
ncbi:MAG: AMP-binding protein, partial [Acidimicrobiales bacterium]